MEIIDIVGIDISSAVNKEIDFVTFLLYNDNRLVQIGSLNGNKIHEYEYNPYDNITNKSIRIASINIYERIVYIQSIASNNQIIIVPMIFDMDDIDNDDNDMNRIYIFTLLPDQISSNASLHDMKPLVVNADNIYLYGPQGLYKYNISDYQSNHVILSLPIAFLASLPSPTDITASDTHLVKSRLLLCFVEHPNPTIYIIDVLLGILYSLILTENVMATIPFNAPMYQYNKKYANYMKQNQVDHVVTDEFEYIVVDRDEDECAEPPLHTTNKRKGTSDEYTKESEGTRFLGSLLLLYRDSESVVKLQLNNIVLTLQSNEVELVPLHEVLIELRDSFYLLKSWSVNITTILLLFNSQRMIKVTITDSTVEYCHVPITENNATLIAQCNHPFVNKDYKLASLDLF